MKFGFVVLLVGLASQASFAAPEASEQDLVCSQCTRLALAEKRLQAMREYSDIKASPLIIDATNAVKRLPVQAGGRLTPAQALAVSRLLAAAYNSGRSAQHPFGNDPDFSIIDGNLKLFKRNAQLFFDTFKTFDQPSERVTQNMLRESLDIKLGEAKYGQDGGGSKKISDPDAEPVDPELIEPIPQKKRR